MALRDIRSLDLSMLRVFDALLHECNVTKAAVRLGLSQPAVSGMLAKLRVAFDDQLFVRTQTGIVPTHRASELASAVRQVVADVENLLRPPVFEPAVARLTLSLAASDYMLSVLAAPFLSSLRLEAPGIRTVIHPLTESVYEDLEAGRVDLALMVSVASRNLRVRQLFRDDFVCVARAGHPAAIGGLSLDEFCTLDHVLVAPDGSFEGRTDEALAKIGRRRRVVLSVGNFLVLPAVLRATDLVAVVPARLIADATGLSTSPPPLPIPGFGAAAVWHERSNVDPGHGWVRSLLRAAGECVSGHDEPAPGSRDSLCMR